MTESRLLRLKIPEAALPSWRALNATLASLDDKVPCAGSTGDRWTSERRSERALAAAACAGCRAMAECRSFATASREIWSVLGGQDHRPQPQTGTTEGKRS